MPLTVLRVPHHCGRGASVWGSGGRWLWGGAECLTQTNAELLQFVFGTESKRGVSSSAHISANCWVVEPFFLQTKHRAVFTVILMYSQLHSLSMSMISLVPPQCLRRGSKVACSITSSSSRVGIQEGREIYPDWVILALFVCFCEGNAMFLHCCRPYQSWLADLWDVSCHKDGPCYGMLLFNRESRRCRRHLPSCISPFWCGPLLSARCLLSLKMNHQICWVLVHQTRSGRNKTYNAFWQFDKSSTMAQPRMWTGTGLLLVAGLCTCTLGRWLNLVHKASSWWILTCGGLWVKHGVWIFLS